MGKIVITGGYGFIGSHFVDYVLQNTNHEVLVVDKLTYAANKDNLKYDVPFIQKDICDVTSEDLGDFDYIVNFAAETHVDNSIIDGRPFVRSNVEGTFNLVEIARKNKNLKKFIQISTDEVYGDMKDDLIINKSSKETDHLQPSSYYSSTKASSDLIVMAASRTYGLPYIITRTCNNYGENQNKEKFIPKIIHSIKENSEVPVYGDGKQVREWIYVKDNVESIYKILISDKVNEIYNIGSGERLENIQIIDMIGILLDKEVKYKFVQDRLGHDLKYSLNSSKFQSDFGPIKKTKFTEWLRHILINEGL